MEEGGYSTVSPDFMKWAEKKKKIQSCSQDLYEHIYSIRLKLCLKVPQVKQFIFCPFKWNHNGGGK